MAILIGFLTFILVMNCLFLMLLILIQLPKKEAGAGIAFGGGATDALFGAGSGNALTKLTKYSGTLFVGLSVLLSVLNLNAYHQSGRRLEQELSRQASAPANVTPAPAIPNVQTAPLTPANPAVPLLPEAATTNLTTKPSTTAAAPATATAPAANPPTTTPAPAPAKK